MASRRAVRKVRSMGRPRASLRSPIAQNLSQLSVGELAQVVWNRLRQAKSSAPLGPLGRDENPADVFIDAFVNGPPGFANRLRAACTMLLARESEGLDHADALGNLIWLCSSIGATKAVGPLREVALRPESGTLLLRGQETLRIRALRALAGLLAENRSLAGTDDRELFERFLTDPQYEDVCLTPLVGLWRQKADQFLGRLRSPYPMEKLNSNLSLAGFV